MIVAAFLLGPDTALLDQLVYGNASYCFSMASFIICSLPKLIAPTKRL